MKVQIWISGKRCICGESRRRSEKWPGKMEVLCNRGGYGREKADTKTQWVDQEGRTEAGTETGRTLWHKTLRVVEYFLGAYVCKFDSGGRWKLSDLKNMNKHLKYKHYKSNISITCACVRVRWTIGDVSLLQHKHWNCLFYQLWPTVKEQKNEILISWTQSFWKWPCLQRVWLTEIWVLQRQCL